MPAPPALQGRGRKEGWVANLHSYTIRMQHQGLIRVGPTYPTPRLCRAAGPQRPDWPPDGIGHRPPGRVQTTTAKPGDDAESKKRNIFITDSSYSSYLLQIHPIHPRLTINFHEWGQDYKQKRLKSVECNHHEENQKIYEALALCDSANCFSDPCSGGAGGQAPQTPRGYQLEPPAGLPAVGVEMRKRKREKGEV